MAHAKVALRERNADSGVDESTLDRDGQLSVEQIDQKAEMNRLFLVALSCVSGLGWATEPSYAQKAGVRPLKLHCTRHTRASLALASGKSVQWVAINSDMPTRRPDPPNLRSRHSEPT